MTGTFDALIENAAVTMAVSIGDAETITVAPIISMNKLSTNTEASITNASTLTAQKGDLTISAKDTSDMDVTVAASSVALSAGTKEAKGISIGISIANNEVKNNVQAYIKHAGSPGNKASVLNGNLIVQSSKEATINSSGSASAIALAAGAKGVQVKSGITPQPPHRSGREQFAHPVPRYSMFRSLPCME
ncbi:hypothetical protein MHK_001496 [Candidatus Magnetomorum sp. HK-1]|nr:hypothetical protein MHK_001496 [Candidatus Magnetomorum sp. HK-1]